MSFRNLHKDENGIIRSGRNGCFIIHRSKEWGACLVPVADPDGQYISEDKINSFIPSKSFPKIPGHIWSRIIKFYNHAITMFPDTSKNTLFSNLEVSVVLLRKEDDLNQWKCCVPRQTVSRVSVKANFENSCDIETGEEYKEFPPVGWLHVGSSHSHNTMSPEFSSVDDASELPVPGIHIVVGEIDLEKNEYLANASIVVPSSAPDGIGIRRYTRLSKVVDMESLTDDTFHPNILNFVTKETKKVKFSDLFKFEEEVL